MASPQSCLLRARQIGQFTALHNVAVERQGNIYTAEVNTGQRIQNSRAWTRRS